MSQVSKVLRFQATSESQAYSFYCPGCKHHHAYTVGPNDKLRWQFNGNLEAPTFSPSLLNRCGHYAGHHKPQADGTCYICEEAKKDGVQSMCSLCHLFVENGMIRFLQDCTHELAGKTVPMVPLTTHEGTETKQ